MKHVVTKLVDRLACACGWAILALSILILFDILLRKLFNISIQGADEIGGFILAITATVGFSYALILNAHIRMDFLFVHFGRRLRAGLNLGALGAMGAFAGLLCWRALVVLWSSFEMQAHTSTPLKTPLAVPQAIWAAGLLLFFIVAFGLFVYCARLLLAGRTAAAADAFGALGPEREVDEELGQTLDAAGSPRERETT